MLDRGRKGIALFIVVGIIMVVVVLTIVILRITASQGRLTHHQVSRIRAYYTDKAGLNLVFYKLRKGTWSAPATGINYYCINAKIDAAVTCLDTVIDATIPYNVQVAVYPPNTGLNQSTKVEIKSNYIFTPS